MWWENGIPIKGVDYGRIENYLIPDLEYPEMDLPPLGKYGMMRKNYLREHRPVIYNELVMTGKLFAHCLEVEASADCRLDILMDGLVKKQGITEALKARDPMAWVSAMNNCKAQAEKIIFSELIYV